MMTTIETDIQAFCTSGDFPNANRTLIADEPKRLSTTDASAKADAFHRSYGVD